MKSYQSLADSYDALMKQIQSVIDADNGEKQY